MFNLPLFICWEKKRSSECILTAFGWSTGETIFTLYRMTELYLKIHKFVCLYIHIPIFYILKADNKVLKLILLNLSCLSLYHYLKNTLSSRSKYLSILEWGNLGWFYDSLWYVNTNQLGETHNKMWRIPLISKFNNCVFLWQSVLFSLK